MRAFVVFDLGFGDAGKGLVTDFLVRATGARVVVRYNGGAQAGHNVVAPDGRHHTFAQFGAATFVPGVRTFLARQVVVHPSALLLEGEALSAKGVSDAFSRLRVSEEARVITPFHQAAGRLREIARGAARHGTCGVGVGEAVCDALARPGDAVRAGDLRDRGLLRRKARRVRERLREEVGGLPTPPGDLVAAREYRIFEDQGLLEAWVVEAERMATLGLVAPEETLARWLAPARAAVFEGAQGVLLDERHGFHPYTTWSRSTPENALELLAEAAPRADVHRLGVLRAYAVRHGPGPLPTETEELRVAVREHNGCGEWQGPVRYGWFDVVLARYGLEVSGSVDSLVLTHLDVPPRLPRWRIGTGYHLPSGASGDDLVAERDGDSAITRLAAPPGHGLAGQQRLTDLLRRAAPRLEPCEATGEAVVQRTERLLSRSIDLVARGPRSQDVATRGACRLGTRR